MLDPIVAIRCVLVIPPDATVCAHVVTGVAPTRDAALTLVDRYHDKHLGDRVLELARTHRQVLLGQLGISEREAQLYLRLASSLVYVGPQRRPASGVLARNRRGQSSLWAVGISGDLPIVLLRCGAQDASDVLRQVVRAHSFWRVVGLRVDLVVLNEDEGGYLSDLQAQLLSLVGVGSGSARLDAPGGIFVRRRDQLTEEDLALLQTVARVGLSGTGGSFLEQVERRGRVALPMPAFIPTVAAGPLLSDRWSGPDPAGEAPQFDNGVGGFSASGHEYRITLLPGVPTPAPWVNVLANPHFGTLVSESGSAYTWCENAHEFRLTPWENDPVADRSGEAFYLRDEETGVVWGATALPMPAQGTYRTSHGFGYSTFRHRRGGIESELTMFVAADAPVKLVLVKLTNRSGRPRTVSVTGYCEWVLGELRPGSLLHVTSEVDPTNGALLARNPFHREFGTRIAFLATSGRTRSLTADRTEFIGRNGALSRPLALGRERLSGRVGAGLDACAALQTALDLPVGESHEVVFALGLGRDLEDVRTLVRRFGTAAAARDALGVVQAQWTATLGAIRVTTPEPAMDVLVNGWLPYQTLACRMWARTGLYQSGGAFGFRDQLQDAMALLHVRPELLRKHVILASGRQYRDGDVQHWWHPPSGLGVRTHCSDDFLWLPLAVSRYVLATGDTGVLDVRTRFIEGRQVRPEEEAYAEQPRVSGEEASVYEHCVAAIRHGLRMGVHGLPLMGSGDWNDGMNRVGHKGRGESVWLGFFLVEVLTRFAEVARQRGDVAFAESCGAESARLSERLDGEAWDGAWYQRAWFDSGEPLGSAHNVECRIDSLPQSWAALTGAGDPTRARRAMEAVYARLVDRANGVVHLFDPPFESADPSPGYVKGYVRGVRENGGQYTHAAIWVAMAYARLGDVSRAWEVARMINPVQHSASPADRERYRVEPYVMAADVYGEAPHAGMGGWTWHTGSAGWMYRLVVESLLGLRVVVDRLFLRPCVPPEWSSFTLDYHFRRTAYRIHAHARLPGEPAGQVTLDGVVLATDHLPLLDDGVPHEVQVTW